MKLDPMVIATIAGPVLAAVAAIAIDRAVRDRPKLICFIIHSGAVRVRRPGQDYSYVFMHFLLVRNVGRKSATGVRISHAPVQCEYSISPDVAYTEADLPGGAKEILLPLLVPGASVTVSYLYAPPVTVNNFNTTVTGDQAAARWVETLPTPQPPRWQIRVGASLMFLGTVAALYLVWLLSARLLGGN